LQQLLLPLDYLSQGIVRFITSSSPLAMSVLTVGAEAEIMLIWY
jgi:hypothetical protein